LTDIESITIADMKFARKFEFFFYCDIIIKSYDNILGLYSPSEGFITICGMSTAYISKIMPDCIFETATVISPPRKINVAFHNVG